MIMRIFIYILLFTGFATNVYAERRALDVVRYQIKPGESEVMVPEEENEEVLKQSKDKRTFKRVGKKHQVKFDSQSGIYTYTYWKHDGTKIDILHEQSNKVKVTSA